MQSSAHVDDDFKNLRWTSSVRWMDEKTRYIKEVLDWHRDEDSRDLKSSDLNESIEILTCLNAFEVKSQKTLEKLQY